jgi:hypothetical protein
MVTIGKISAMPVNIPFNVNISNWASPSWASSQIFTQVYPMTSWGTMSSVGSTSIDQYIPISWDYQCHDYYVKPAFLTQTSDNLILRFTAGCTRCDSYAVKTNKCIYMHVLPLVKEVLLSTDIVASIFGDQTKALDYATQEYKHPMFKELHELHSAIDNLYTEDYRQQGFFTVKF